MNKKIITVVAVAAAMALTGCSTFNQQQYSYQLDEERMKAEPALTRTSAQNGHVVWVNPPQKRVKIDSEQ